VALSLNITHNSFDDIRKFCRNFLFVFLIFSWIWWHSKCIIHCSMTDWSLVEIFFLKQLWTVSALIVIIPLTGAFEFAVVLRAEVRRFCSREPRTVDRCVETNQHAAARRRPQRTWELCTAVANASRRCLPLTNTGLNADCRQFRMIKQRPSGCYSSLKRSRGESFKYAKSSHREVG